jgi:hypothetical protein
LVACTALFFIGGAQAVHEDGIFELDGNATQGVNSTPAMPNFSSSTEDADNICAKFAVADPTPGTNPADDNPADQHCHANPSVTLPSATVSTRSAFVTDAAGPWPSGLSSDDQYTGGSEDDNDVSTWKFKTAASSNDKSDIQNAFFAEYDATIGGSPHKIAYFGGDRSSNNGDENTAFWLMQNAVSENGDNADGTCSKSSGCGFNGIHRPGLPGADNCYEIRPGVGVNINANSPGAVSCTESSTEHDQKGDLLIVSAFTTGGTQPNIQAYVWMGAKAINSKSGLCITSACSVLKVFDSANPGCSPLVSGDPACAITNQPIQYNTCPGPPASPGSCVAGNTIPTTSPWLFKDVDGTTNAFKAGDYFEAGVDLTALGLGGECTSTFTMNTRSSQSVNASLQDLAIGQVGSCQSSLSTTPKNGAGDTTVSDTSGTGNNLSIGSGTVKATDLADLKVTGIGSWSGTLKFFLCGPIPAGDTCDPNAAAGHTHTGLQIGSDISVNQSSGTDDGSGGRLISSAQALLTSAANKSTGAPGHYCWRGEFHSATSGVDDKTDASSGECFIVNPVKPSLTTSATCSASPCILGSTLSDTATLSNAATKPGTTGPSSEFPSIYQGSATPTLAKAGGTINWTLYGPASDGSAQCSTTKTLTTSSASVINGNDTYPKTAAPDNQSPISYTTSAANDGLGIYTFAASYAGNSPNTLAADDVACSTTTPVTSEQVTVASNASTSTTQKWLPQDTAHVTATGGATVAGYVVFQLFESIDCSGAAVQTFGGDPSARITVDSSGNATTNNITYYVDKNVQISWKATFHSTNNVASGDPAPCERSDIANLDDDITSP